MALSTVRAMLAVGPPSPGAIETPTLIETVTGSPVPDEGCRPTPTRSIIAAAALQPVRNPVRGRVHPQDREWLVTSQLPPAVHPYNPSTPVIPLRSPRDALPVTFTPVTCRNTAYVWSAGRVQGDREVRQRYPGFFPDAQPQVKATFRLLEAVRHRRWPVLAGPLGAIIDLRSDDDSRAGDRG